MKIFWVSNAPWAPSGYGQTTARFAPRLKALGHDVAIGCNYGLSGAPLEWEGLPCYPASADPWLNDVVSAYTLHHFRGKRNAGWLVYLQDTWTVTSEKIKDLHVAAWAPVDHTPAPPPVIHFFNATGAVPLAMSKHGFSMFEQAGLKPLYVPHGTDTNLFKPQDTRKKMRDGLGIPQDAYVFGMVANNNGAMPSRKSFPEALQAFKTIHERHPDAHLYLHTLRSKAYNGLDFDDLLGAIGMPSGCVTFVDQFGYTLGEVKTEDMPNIYAAMDCLLNPAMGEGFGMPIIEAQACGVPVILADNTAMSDLCGAGWLIPSYPLWDPFQKSWWGSVHVDELVEAMEEAYGKGQGIRQDGVDFVRAEYDADLVTKEHWVPALATLQRMLHAPEAKPVDMRNVLSMKQTSEMVAQDVGLHED